MLVVALLAFMGNAIQYQNAFELCKKIDYKDKACKLHLKAVKANPKSKHYR